MVEKNGSLAARFKQLKGKRSYQKLSDQIYAKTGQRISAQGLHKWSKGGQVTNENLNAAAEFFGVTRSWLLFGEGEEQTPPWDAIPELIRQLPDDRPGQVVDFLEYQLEKAKGLIASDSVAKYHEVIADLRRDLERRRKEGTDDKPKDVLAGGPGSDHTEPRVSVEPEGRQARRRTRQ